MALSVEHLRRVRAFPVVIDQRDSAVALPLVPAVFTKGEHLSHGLPFEQVFASCQVGFIPHLVHADVQHVPLVVEAKNAGAIDRLLLFALQNDAKFERRLHFVEDPLHGFSGDRLWLRGGWHGEETFRGVETYIRVRWGPSAISRNSFPF